MTLQTVYSTRCKPWVLWIQAFYDRQLSAMELVQQRLLKDIEDRLEAELEANGVANEDAVDKARKALEVAKATADEAGIIEAEKALKKAEIEKKYADEKLKAEQDYAWKVAQIEYAFRKHSLET